ncbi:MAG: 4-carboxymuconolactone decarboxylase [Robiginitomaculum sp.]|nr:MAG: 4-carboxymuconolactone decarboxylase [Robiginitomaculum sp.]
MFNNINEIRQFRKKYSGKLFLSGIGTFKKLSDAEEDALKEGALSQKQKELIALGISVSNKCYGCIEFHLTRLLDLNSNRKEILEATVVAVALSGSTADYPARYVIHVLEELENNNQ